MASSPTTATPTWGQSPLAYFLAGMIVPTITYFILNKRAGKNRSSSSSIDSGDGEWEDTDDDDDSALPLFDGDNPSASWTVKDAPYKMVLIVNTSLGMGKGM